MRWTEESWRPAAEALGFTSEEEMLRNLYLLQKHSIKQIAHTLGYSTFAVRRRLLILNVQMRQRGGDKRSGKHFLKDVTHEELFTTPREKLAEKYGVDPSTVSVERQRRKKELNLEEIKDDVAILPDCPDVVRPEGG